jgi:hypothetical protein
MKEAHLGPLSEWEHTREAQGTYPACNLRLLAGPPHEMQVLKRHGVRQGESVLGADYNVLSA